MVRGYFDARCPKCGKAITGTLEKILLSCPHCHYELPVKDIEADRQEMEKFAEYLRARKAARDAKPDSGSGSGN